MSRGNDGVVTLKRCIFDECVYGNQVFQRIRAVII